MPLTSKPVLRRYYSPSTGDDRLLRYARTHEPKLSQRTFRERYRKASIRLRKVGSREATSVRLARIYEVPSGFTRDQLLALPTEQFRDAIRHPWPPAPFDGRYDDGR